MSETKPMEGQLTIIDAEGNEKLCQILFTIDSEEFNKKYVVFFPLESMDDEEEDDDSEKVSLMAAVYKETGNGTGELEEIQSDEEWQMLEDALADYEENMDQHECHCDCDHDCDGDCDCDGECDGEHEGHCCCHHEE